MTRHSPQYDIIVIGSGPAGTAAAINAVQSGCSVLLITASGNGPGVYQAIESVHSGIEVLLTGLKATKCFPNATIGVYEGINTAGTNHLLGSDESGAWTGLHISRAAFDFSLLQSAIAQGVVVAYNEKVTNFLYYNSYITGIQTNTGQTISGKYLIDASGCKRFAGKKLQLKERYFSPILVTMTGIQKNISLKSEIFNNNYCRFIPGRYGWTWIAPLPTGRCSWTQLSLKGMYHPEAIPASNLGDPDGEIKKRSMRWRIFRPVCQEGLILCGDAAGAIDPAAGQGILFALFSGIKAAQTAVACIRLPDYESLQLANYDDWFTEQLTGKIKMLKNYYIENGIEIFTTSG